MTSPSPVPDNATIRSDSVASTRDSASLLAELASQAIVLLNKADPPTVVTGLLKEKSYLHTQNGQLWRLVDKQRAALLDLQRDYQKVLQDKNKYQARLKTLQQQRDPPRSFDENSTSTEASAPATLDTDTSSQDPNKQTPSRRSSARSVRMPRSPQAGAQLDALQASLEAEIAKNSDDSDRAPTPAMRLHSSGSDVPYLAVEVSSPHTVGGKIKRVPTPLDLSPAKVRASEPASRSAFLAPRSGSPRMANGRLSPYGDRRDPPPSAPPFQQTYTTEHLSSTARKPPPPLFSPGIPKSPRAFLPSAIPVSPMFGEIVSDERETRVADPPPPSTPRSKTFTDPDDFTDSSMSPATPVPPSPSSRDALVEAARKSPLVPRRSRIPSHRSNPSASHTSTSSIGTINGPTYNVPTYNGPIITTTSPVASRSSRSMSLEWKELPLGRSLLLPPQEAIERRKSRSFEDLHSLSDSFDQMQKEEEDKFIATKDSTKTSSGGIGLEETILEMQRANEPYSPPTLTESPQRAEFHTFPAPPKRPAPPTPPQQSPTSTQTPPALQPPFTARARSGSSASKLVPLAINPNDVPNVLLSVLSVRSRQVPTNTGPVEETLFTIRCRVKNTVDKTGDKEILRVEKSFASLMELGDKVGSVSGMAPFLRSFFDDFPIEKPEQRKAVDYFFGVLLGTQLDDKSLHTIAEFLSSDIVQKHDPQFDRRGSGSTSTPTSVKSPTRPTISTKGLEPPTKQGYLTKRGKNFGGWQTRYFVLDGPQLKYFDTPNGVHLGSIKLPQAQIGRQTVNSQQTETDDSGDEQMKFAFLILEPKRNDASKMVRHVLCSQSDDDRDEWIQALLFYVALEASPISGPQTQAEKPASRGKRLQRRGTDQETVTHSDPTSPTSILDTPQNDAEIIGIRYDQMAAGKRPTVGPGENKRQSSWSQDDPPRGVDSRRARSPDVRPIVPLVPVRSPYRGAISGPMNGAPITDDAAWNSAQREEERRREEKRAKKRSVWGFLSKETKGRSTPEDIQATAPPPPALLQHGLFGIPLREAVEITREMGMGINIPSVVYRCVEYLEHMDAAKEEGIYRLSGSNSAIRMLKDRFNSEGDVDLVNSKDYHDVHAVAGLLKLYLRELPSTVLTRERHGDFLHIVDIEDKNARVNRLTELVHGLPKVNYELLRVMSKHLKRIVKRSQENKMTIRNVGIVFSPTLNIPAPVLSLFITEYEVVFDEPDDVPETTTTPPAPEPLPYNNSYTESPPAAHPNHHLNVHDQHSQPSHRRYHSADPPHRVSAVPPASFPVYNRGYQEPSPARQAANQQQQPYPQQSYQQSFQQQQYRNYLSPQPTYQQGRWASSREEADLFG